MSIAIRPLAPADAAACDAIVLGHPDFFGHEGGRDDCARAVRSQAGRVAEEDGRVLGFAVWTERTAATAEITWMAVERERRFGGIGTAIVETVVADLWARGYKLALVMTSAAHKRSPGIPDAPPAEVDTYEPTRRFWLARGFLPVIELDIWETDIALLSVRLLTP